MNTPPRPVDVRQLMDQSGVHFGTSGARGLACDMTAPVCFAYTAAFLQVVAPPPGTRVALGLDLRPSSPHIAGACAAAIRAAGLIPDFCGVLPTPALAYYAQEQGIPAIMVTGSHIPFDRNGIKFYRATGEISKADEAGIAAATVALPGDIRPDPLPEANPAAAAAYLRRYLDFFPAGILAGLRLGFYEHSSVARDLFRHLLEALGAEVTSLGRTDQFVPIDTEAVGAEDVARARTWAQEYGFDALLSTDGDADRPLIGDERGEWLRGDVVGILCARYLGARAVATPVSSNTALEACGAFPHIVRTRIGSPYVIEGMEELARTEGAGVVGYEANGGFLVGSAVLRGGRRLAPLPTRDAVLPILALLAMSRERGVPLSRLPAELPARFTASDRLRDFPAQTSRQLLDELAASAAALAAFLAPLRPLHTDLTDGLRVFLEADEIVHLRPSGNAPELRCYAEADSPARAGELAATTLARAQAWRAGAAATAAG